MDDSLAAADVSTGLEELLELHIRRLSETLSRPYTLDEIEAELSALNNLVYNFKRRDELLERLLDTATAENKRQQILATLRAQRLLVAENQAEVQRLYAKSHELLERSLQLVLRAQLEINKRAHTHAGYKLEMCALCQGAGGINNNPCIACKGKGNVLVHQPSLRCPRCSGKPIRTDQLAYSGVCMVCRGSGWVMTRD